MLPFAIIGVTLQDWLSYGLLSELEPRKQSVLGAKAVQMHFPAGYAGPLTVLLRNDQVDFREAAGRVPLETLIEGLQEQHEKLGIVDIRYVVHPLGLSDPSVYATREGTGAALAIWRKRQEIRRRGSEEYYISSKGEFDGHVTRVDIIFKDDPFSRESIHQLNSVEQAFQAGLAELPLAGNTQLHFVGPTASIRDLKTVTDADQVRIDMLVLLGVFLILFALLRKPAISLYLIVSVYFSYLVTLGVAFTVFYLLDPVDFAGLDWKVPMFLFTILIAIGEDYNIFLMTRIEEEQRRHGPVEGVRIALFRTGSIISSCGIIMAGTFCSLMFGTLVGMQQLGFALAFGVLLDTFVVRPILVPAYLILLYSGRFGVLGRFLGQTNLRSVNVAAVILMVLSLCYVMYGIN
jgi:RND superfamily putative drug exporter